MATESDAGTGISASMGCSKQPARTFDEEQYEEEMDSQTKREPQE